MKYDKRELGDYYRGIADEKNYFYITRLTVEGLKVDHVWGYDIENWKARNASDGESVFYGFDVFCSTCSPQNSELKKCSVVTRKNKIGRWNKDKIGRMRATSSGWVDFQDEDGEATEWRIKIIDKKIPDWYLGPNSVYKSSLSLLLLINMIFIN